MMNHSLYYKFILGYLVFDLLGFTAIITVSSKMIYSYPMEGKAEVLYDEANLIASNYSMVYQGKFTDAASTYPQLKAVAVFTQTGIWVVERRGTIVVDSSYSDKVGTTIQGFDPTFISSKSYCVGSYYDCLPGEAFSVSTLIIGNYNVYGYVIIHLPLSQITAAQNDILNILCISTRIIFTLSLIILLAFTQMVRVPLKKITAAANQYARGNLGCKTELHTHDKTGYLATILNYVSDGLDQMERYQHTLITNVSHDSHSPLTSIKGHLEAILDGIVSLEMYEKYLARVITETEQPNKLAQGMLTLNSLGNKGYLSRANFGISRVIKDTAAPFEGIYENKDIMLDLTFSDSVQMVHADMGRIQQALYNLIDNATKFSHYDSIIYIRTSTRNEKAFVSAENAGIGIPKPNRKKIWERFHESDLSCNKDKKGIGPDLVIVKEIIQSHGENIDCVSTEGVGMEFTFSLPRSISL